MLPIFLNASDTIVDALIPYDDNGFYAGSIIILFIIYVAIPLFIVMIGGLILYFIFPKILAEFQMLIGLYYEGKLIQGVKRHLIHFLIFTIFVLIFIMILKMFQLSYFYLLITLIFCYSSFFGFYIFLYTVIALYHKNIQKALFGFLLGSFVSISFLGSAYAIFQPLYKKIYEKKYNVPHKKNQ